jgi:hypothetical protein
MSRTHSALAITSLAAPLLLLSAAPASAEERDCRGTIRAATVDNLRVPQYANCVLLGTRVKGTIKVEWNATLRAEDIVVIGNVQAENAKSVRVLDGSRVGGSVQVKQGGGAVVSDSRIEGDIQYDANSAMLRVLRNIVGGSVQAFQNTGGLEVRRNRIDGNLQCKENAPRPVGGGNIVGGNKEDQCARL